MTFQADSRLVHAVVPSPNHEPRRDEREPDILLLHYTDMPSAEAAIALLADPASKVSAHYVIAEDGRITQMVPEARRAWHAGIASWEGESDINSASIGIEIANAGHDHGYPDFPPAQIEAVTALGLEIAARWSIPPERVLAHSDVAPRRKRDPGEKFPWGALAARGLGHHVRPAPLGGGRFLAEGDAGERVEALQSMLALYGYPVEITGRYDALTTAVVVAFQRHFRPQRIDGVADASTVTTLRDLLAALPARGSET